MLPLLLALCSPAQAKDGYAKGEIRPKYDTDFTAYTAGLHQWRLGPLYQSFGLLDNVQVGTAGALWVLSVPNFHAKVTAIQTDRLDASFDYSWYGFNLEKSDGIPGGYISVAPLGWTASWLIRPKASLHFGMAWVRAQVKGELTPTQIGNLIGNNLSEDLGDLVVRIMPEESSLYAGLSGSISQTRLAFDYRLNRRDSVIFTWNPYWYAQGLAAAGYEDSLDTDVGSADVQVGASAEIGSWVYGYMPTPPTLSWQMTWDRLAVRAGIPLNPGGTLSWPRAVGLHIVLPGYTEN